MIFYGELIKDYCIVSSKKKKARNTLAEKRNGCLYSLYLSKLLSSGQSSLFIPSETIINRLNYLSFFITEINDVCFKHTEKPKYTIKYLKYMFSTSIYVSKSNIKIRYQNQIFKRK